MLGILLPLKRGTLDASARHLLEATCTGFISNVSYLCSTAHFPLFTKQFMIIPHLLQFLQQSHFIAHISL